MGCGQCSTGGCGAVKLLNNKEKSNHKTVAGCSSGGCSSGGCNKMNSYDWLSNMDIPRSMRFNIVEVKFKGGRKEYFRNENNLELYTGDFVVCEMPTGYHIGTVAMQGELVRLQMIKKGVQDDENVKKILRVATEKDMEKHEQAINRDLPTMYRVREITKDLKLQMKLSDVEYQSDNTKATFFYSADDRVDFRELIKLLAAEFKIRVEMRQISLRQEAARVGGIGSCGRELCCSTWLTDFRAIPTSAARYQNLSLNPAKLSGQCGRLKCCLNYELDTYLDALSDIPTVEKPLQTEKGVANLQKTDIFRRIMWFSYNNDSNWHSLPMAQVVKILAMNEKGLKPNSLDDLSLANEVVVDRNQPRNTDLDKLDKKFTDRNRKPNFQNNQPKQQNQGNQNSQNNQPKQSNQGNQNFQNKDNAVQSNKGGNQQNQGNKQPNQQNQGNRGNQPQNQQHNKQQHNKPNNPNQGNKGNQPQQNNQNRPNPNQQGGVNKENTQPQGNSNNPNNAENPEKQGGNKHNKNRHHRRR